MSYTVLLRRTAPLSAIIGVVLAVSTFVHAQGGGAPRPPQAPQMARAAAPMDLTGYWVSIITEDWAYRMVTPPKGDYRHIYMLNAEGRRVANMWDPARDIASGNLCKAYGAVGIMRQPGRLHITWQDDSTLRIDFDNGTQTRLLHFGKTPTPTQATLQGHSIASWEFVTIPGQPRAGGLKVVTTQMLPGYVRTNGVPYSENAVLTEYFDRHTILGHEWITHTRVLEDPKYLDSPHIVTTDFRKEPDGSKWHPTPCEVIPSESILPADYDFDAEPGNTDER